MIGNLLLALSGIVLLVLSLGVYLSNPKRSVNRALTVFLLSGFLWLTANLLTNISTTQSAALFFAKSTLVGAALIPLTFLIFTAAYTGRRITLGFFAVISLLPAIILLFTPTSLNIVSVEANGRDTVAGSVYILLLSVLVTYFSYGIYILVRYYTKASPLEKVQLQYIFAGVILTLIPAFITNGILPVLGSGQSSAYGPISVMAMSVFTTVAIVRHQLLDIRLVVARSVAYVLVLITLGLIYGSVIFTVTQLVVSDSFRDSTMYQIINVVLVVILAMCFQPIKRFFDRITNEIFYRDAYDTQAVLDELGGVIVATIDLHRIIVGTRSVLSDALKSSFIEFILFENGKPYLQSVSSRTLQMELQELSSHIRQQKKEIFITEELARTSPLKEWLAADHIAVSVRLKTQHQLVGYILFGEKRGGDTYTEQDIKLLTIAANELAIAIQNALRFEEIKQFNITLKQKVEEATRELRNVNARLREMDKTKDEFISMASHQLRTPLTAVKGYLSMILDGDTGPVKKTQKELVQRSFDGAQKMVYLIADMLNVSRLQTGKFVIELKPTDLAEVIASEVRQLEEQVTSRKQKMNYKKPDKFPLLNLDETKIRQVVMNFIDNAVYYTPGGGQIDVKLEATPDSVNFTVTDTGLGVPKSVQHHLFAKFYRADNAKKMRPDGTGLGLYMAKKVVVAQGGAVTFKSEEGKGSVFGFSFPREATEVKAVSSSGTKS